ncbi:hypothetical protein QBC40DRAFT_299528 [Triangularia verruculosa]|uniref:Uncharacterized protein n=1 Tax=Triangularia verruculosa TaxID=2587418 RepID=A0AAN7AQF1_9PEZI|nr:hypothetical protein QBC40DRAFT_299528 [Triangularia verruculosa]
MQSVNHQSNIAQRNGNFFSPNHQFKIHGMDRDIVLSHPQSEADFEMNLDAPHSNGQSEVHQIKGNTDFLVQPIINLQKASSTVEQAPVLWEQDRAARRLLGFSETCRGDVHSVKNIQPDILGTENVSLFLTNLSRIYNEKDLILALLPHR